MTRASDANGRTGFTLVELLVVVAIIGLLAAMAVPSFQQVLRIGGRTVCLGNLRSVAVAMRAYLDQNNDVMPRAAQMPSLGLNNAPAIAEVLSSYLNKGHLKCPSDTARPYHETEGSSYEYQSMLGGRTVAESFLTRHFGEERTPVMNDYEPFHGRPGTPGAANYLFADGHVGDLK